MNQTNQTNQTRGNLFNNNQFNYSLDVGETSDLTQCSLDGDWVRAVKCDDGSEKCIVLRSAGQDTAAHTTGDDLDTEDLKDDERERCSAG